MRVAFIDFCNWDFSPVTVDTIPLGGAHSAACYLCRALAKIGHEVFLFTGTSAPGTYDGVICLNAPSTTAAMFASYEFDAMVCLLAPASGQKLREALGPQTRLIFWTGHAADQRAIQSLRDPEIRDAFDQFAMVSAWQQSAFAKAFEIDPARVQIMRNAIAPAFENLFPDSDAILPHKTSPPVFAYTSTPYRGLDVLLDIFPRIRAAVPGAELRVFSSMKPYFTPEPVETAQFAPLYERCRQTPGVRYIGSLPQPQLAQAMREVSIFAYPNSFAETSCIAVMEAMASGCRIITSSLGALPETTAGFARLVPMQGGRQMYAQNFTREAIESCRELAESGAQCEEQLRRQITHMNSTATWNILADEWSQWLQAL